MDDTYANRPISKPLGRVRLSDQPRRLLVQMLDAKAAAVADSVEETRREPRYPYHARGGVLLTLQHVGGNWERYRIWPRNISRNGLGFFHGGFLHTGSYCRFELQTCDGTIVPHEGHVVHCRFIVHQIHEVGVKFLDPLDINRFVEELADVGDARFTGQVLIVDNDAEQRRKLKRDAQQLGLGVFESDDAPEAVDLTLSNGFDLVLIAPALPSMPRDEMINLLREDGYTGPLISWGDADNTDPHNALCRPHAMCDLQSLLTHHLPPQKR